MDSLKQELIQAEIEKARAIARAANAQATESYFRQQLDANRLMFAAFDNYMEVLERRRRRYDSDLDEYRRNI